MSDQPIGIIDSGLGGLAIALSIWEQLPYENTVYLADHAFFPYGEKPTQALNRRLVTLTNFLLSRNIKALVLACNTATVSSVDFLRQLYSFPIIGVEPAVKPLLADHEWENIVALVTPSTAKRGFYGSEKVRVQSCPGLAEKIEEYATKPRQLRQAIKHALTKINHPYSALVLGCTHYLLIEDLFRKQVKPGVMVINPAGAVASQTESVLAKMNVLSRKSNKPERVFLTTGNSRQASEKAQALLKQSIMFTSCNL